MIWSVFFAACSAFMLFFHALLDSPDPFACIAGAMWALLYVRAVLEK